MATVAALSVLAGITTGMFFRSNVLLTLCVVSAVMHLAGAAVGVTSVMTGVVSVIALQVGYFVAVVIQAMRLSQVDEAAYAKAPVGDAARVRSH